MESSWVVGTYKAETAKRVLANAHAGVGSYIVLEQSGTSANPECVVAFRYTGEWPLADHLTVVKDPYKIQQYEKTRKERQGLR